MKNVISKSFKSLSRNLILLIVPCMFFYGCKEKKESDKKDDIGLVASSQKENGLDKNKVIDVTTRSMEFKLPKEIPSGWNTFRYHNLSNETHFFVFEKMPEGVGLKEYEAELIPPFKRAFALMNEGRMEEGAKAFEDIPKWFYNVVFNGGPGLIGPKKVAQTSMKLDPGVYVIECYVRMADGTPHAIAGMVAEVTVTEDDSDLMAPSPDFEVDISTKQGIEFSEQEIAAGDYTFAVNFGDQKVYENFVGHDVNLVKMEGNPDPKVLANWIDSANIQSFRTPTPDGFTFLGGTQEAPANTTTYFHASLSSGNYVLISEVPNAIERGLFKTFKVSNSLSK